MISKDMVRNAIHGGLKEVLKKGEVSIRDDETFPDYGVDSLDQMNLVLELEKRLKIDLADMDLEKVNSVDLVYDFVCQKHGQQ
jgi:acyl carrier protein